MNPLKNLPLVYAISAFLFTLITVAVTAQNKVEGSRPGQTYRIGESEGQQQPVQQPVPQQFSPQQPVPQQYGPGYGAPLQSQAPLPAQSQQTADPGTAIRGVLPAGAPVIVEFSDLQCPDSARYNSRLKADIMKRFVGDGKADYQWRDFPLPSHANAPEAAVAARCAGGSADRMRQLIMQNQGQMSSNVYAQYARQLGVAPETFSACVRSERTMQQVQQDRALGESFGVSATPTLVLGTSDGRGGIQPVKLVKAYNPPEQVLAEVDSFISQTTSASPSRPVQ